MKTSCSVLSFIAVAVALLFSLTGCIGFRDPDASIPVPEPKIVSGLEQVWAVCIGSNRLAGGVASDPSERVIYALPPVFKGQQFNTCVQLSADGRVEREFNYKPDNGRLRTARLRSETARDLVFFDLWAGNVVAADTRGAMLWKRGSGMNDVWVADLDGDGFDEVIVGYAGSPGLRVFDARGSVLWKKHDIGNAWGVCAADLEGDGKPEVISTSSRGKVHVFKSDGTRLQDFEPPPGYYARRVRPVKLSDFGRSEGILVTGGGGRLAALKSDGTLAWQAPFDTPPAGGAAEPAPGKPWLALQSGSVVVLDTRTGSTIGELKNTGRCELCWLEVRGQSSPLLVVSTRQRVYAYRIRR